MRNIYVGDVGVAVQYLQLALKRAGYLKEISGQFNRETCNALKAFLGEGVGCYVDRAVCEADALSFRLYDACDYGGGNFVGNCRYIRYTGVSYTDGKSVS